MTPTGTTAYIGQMLTRPGMKGLSGLGLHKLLQLQRSCLAQLHSGPVTNCRCVQPVPLAGGMLVAINYVYCRSGYIFTLHSKRSHHVMPSSRRRLCMSCRHCRPCCHHRIRRQCTAVPTADGCKRPALSFWLASCDSVPR